MCVYLFYLLVKCLGFKNIWFRFERNKVIEFVLIVEEDKYL